MPKSLTRLTKLIKYPEKLFLSLLLFTKKCRVRKRSINNTLYYEYLGELYPDELNKGNASSHIQHKASDFCKGKGLDIGAGEWPFPGSIPIRNEPQRNAYILDSINDNSLDYIFSSHCLEHLDDWDNALSLWITKLKHNGILFLYLPHASMKLWEPGGPWAGYLHRWQPKHSILVPFLIGKGLTIVESSSERDDYWSFYIISKK